MPESTFTERRESERTYDPATGEERVVETVETHSESPEPEPMPEPAPVVVVAEDDSPPDWVTEIRDELRAVRDDIVSLAERMEKMTTTNNIPGEPAAGTPGASPSPGASSPASPAPISTQPEPTTTEVTPPPEATPAPSDNGEPAPKGKRRPGWLF